MLHSYDVIIVGTGVSGLYAALNLDKSLKVLVLSKNQLTLSNSSLAQGGIAAVHDKQNDSVELHFHDTMIAGGNRNNVDTLKILVEEGPGDVERLWEYGVNFDKDNRGNIHLTLEGGHSRPRIWHFKDYTGRAVVETLLSIAAKYSNIDLVENAHVCDLKKEGSTFSIDVLQDGAHETYSAHFCILGTGGIGRVYEHTTNSAIATGDGIMLAHELGAVIRNLHLVQFHPTAFSSKNSRECFLISEAVRGEGAYLLNCEGKRFMQNYDDRLELAPRDVVSHSMIQEAQKTKSNDFYLDITHKDSEFIKNRFPMIYQNLLQGGYDLTTDRVPVFPCQHYLMGGIDVDADAETTVDGLYAVGECSHTGIHGNNRLASNSLLEAVVFSRRAAQDINARMKKGQPALTPYSFHNDEDGKPLPQGLRTEVRSIMQSAYFVIPDPHQIKKGFARVCELKELLETGGFAVTPDFVEAKALTTVAYLILKEVL